MLQGKNRIQTPSKSFKELSRRLDANFAKMEHFLNMSLDDRDHMAVQSLLESFKSLKDKTHVPKFIFNMITKEFLDGLTISGAFRPEEHSFTALEVASAINFRAPTQTRCLLADIFFCTFGVEVDSLVDIFGKPLLGNATDDPTNGKMCGTTEVVAVSPILIGGDEENLGETI